MASGKTLGEFSYKAVTVSYSPGPAGSVLAHANWEGNATGFGAVFVTATYVGGGKGGSYSDCGVAYMDNGDSLSGIGQGTTESTGKHQWRSKGFVQLSDGRRMAVEGEINLASRSWKGTLSEMS